LIQAQGFFAWSRRGHEFKGVSNQARTYADTGDDIFEDSETDPDEPEAKKKDKKPRKERLKEL